MDEQRSGMFCAWRRYWARSLDLFLYGLLWCAFAVLVLHSNLSRGGLSQNMFNTIMQMLVMLAVEPLLLNRFKTTPGKAVFGIRVTQENGERLTVSQGFSRTLGVLIKGMGLSIPIYSLYTYYKSYGRCEEREIQPWDEGISYTIKDTRGYRWLIFVAANVAVFVCLIGVILAGQIPPNRGQLTVAEFAENYNHLACYYNLESGGEYLGEDGTWQKKQEPGGVIISIPDVPAPDFVYEVKDGAVTGISVSVEFRDRDEWLPTYDTQMMLAVLAYAGAQKGIGLFSGDRMEMADCVASNYFRGYHIVYRGIDITCERESEGYQSLLSGILVPEDTADRLYMRTDFSMRQDESAAGAHSPVCTYQP